MSEIRYLGRFQLQLKLVRNQGNKFGNIASEYCDAVVANRNKYISLYLNDEYRSIYSIRDEIPLEKECWDGSAKQMLRDIKGFLAGRPEYIINNLCSVLHFSPEEKEHYFGHLPEKQA